MKDYKIYTLADPVTGEIRYVGQTTRTLERRLKCHVDESRKRVHEHSHRLNWIRSLDKKGLKPTIELLDDNNVIWNETEIYWISQFRTWGFNLINATDGGNSRLNIVTKGFSGRKHTEETKRKIGLIHKGRKLSQEVIEKIRQTHIGSKRSAKSRYKMSMAQRNKKLSDKTKLKIGLAHLGKKYNINRPIVQCRKDGTIVKEYLSLKRASEETEISYNTLAECVYGKNKTVKGYIWKKVWKVY